MAIMLSRAPAAVAQAPPVFATGVDVVAVDVSVVDKDGRPVPGLGAGDFTLTVGGRPRRIVSVEFVKEPDSTGEAGETAAGAPPEPALAGYSTNENVRPGRLILIAVDQGNIQMGTGRGTIAATAKLLDRLSPADKVGLIAIPGPGPRIEFTTDHASVREALRNLVGRGRLGGRGVSLTEALAFARGDDPDRWKAAVARECGGSDSRADSGVVETQSAGRSQGGDPCVEMLKTEAQEVAWSYRQQSEASINVLRSLFDVLKAIDAPKTLVLITQGLGEPESGSRAGFGFAGDIRPLGERAAAARVAMFAVRVNEAGGGLTGADANLPLGVVTDDQSFHEYGLETLADVARGVVLRGAPELAFERVAREISGHYLLGFEAEAKERDGKNHKLAVKVARSGATVRTWQSVSLPPAASPKQQEQSLAASLRSPQPATAIPVRVASYALPDAASRKVRVLVVAELGDSTASGSLDVAYVLVDAKDKVVASATQQGKDSTPKGARVPFATSLLVEPGLYTLKLAARDHLGRTGRVDHPVKASVTVTPGGEIETGDLLYGPLPASGTTFRPAVTPDLAPGPVVVRWDVFARDPRRLQGGEAVVEIAASETAPAMGSTPARLASAEAPGHDVVQAVLQLQDLSPGDYVLRVILSVPGQPATTVTRPLRLAMPRDSDAKEP
jgi:VWFA-related protein